MRKPSFSEIRLKEVFVDEYLKKVSKYDAEVAKQKEVC